MPKRKRTVNDELDQKLTESEQELFRALKTAKGFERQRLSKRVQQDKAFPDKLQKYDREIAVLKSLDLQQTAHAHLSSALLRIKPVAEHPALPASFKVGAPKAAASDEDKVALHNVTSGLSNRPVVREVVDKAVRAVCLALEVPLPDKRRKGRKGEKEPVYGGPEHAPAAGDKHAHEQEGGASRANQSQPDSDQSDSFEGFSDGGSEKGDTDDEAGSDDDDMDENDEEAAMAKYESLVGDSYSEEEDAEELRAKYSALLSANPEDLSPGDDEEDESDEYEDDLGSDEEDVGDGEPATDNEDDVEEAEESVRNGPKQSAMLPRRPSISPSRSPSPPPTVRKPKEAKPSKPAGSTTFLPSLMGGYFSGSESASDVDVAPRKKRLGQRQRQAIAERKHGEKANHVQKQQQQQKGKGGRDSGWDMRRGAVEGEGGDKGRKPRRKGPPDARGGGRGSGRGDGPSNHDQSGARRPRKGGHGGGQAADQGPLHPSWQARKKEKQAQQSAAFSGTKITF